MAPGKDLRQLPTMTSTPTIPTMDGTDLLALMKFKNRQMMLMVTSTTTTGMMELANTLSLLLTNLHMAITTKPTEMRPAIAEQSHAPQHGFAPPTTAMVKKRPASN